MILIGINRAAACLFFFALMGLAAWSYGPAPIVLGVACAVGVFLSILR